MKIYFSVLFFVSFAWTVFAQESAVVAENAVGTAYYNMMAGAQMGAIGQDLNSAVSALGYTPPAVDWNLNGSTLQLGDGTNILMPTNDPGALIAADSCYALVALADTVWISHCDGVWATNDTSFTNFGGLDVSATTLGGVEYLFCHSGGLTYVHAGTTLTHIIHSQSLIGGFTDAFLIPDELSFANSEVRYGGNILQAYISNRIIVDVVTPLGWEFPIPSQYTVVSSDMSRYCDIQDLAGDEGVIYDMFKALSHASYSPSELMNDDFGFLAFIDHFVADVPAMNTFFRVDGTTGQLYVDKVFSDTTAGQTNFGGSTYNAGVAQYYKGKIYWFGGEIWDRVLCTDAETLESCSDVMLPVGFSYDPHSVEPFEWNGSDWLCMSQHYYYDTTQYNSLVGTPYQGLAGSYQSWSYVPELINMNNGQRIIAPKEQDPVVSMGDVLDCALATTVAFAGPGYLGDSSHMNMNTLLVGANGKVYNFISQRHQEVLGLQIWRYDPIAQEYDFLLQGSQEMSTSLVPGLQGGHDVSVVDWAFYGDTTYVLLSHFNNVACDGTRSEATIGVMRINPNDEFSLVWTQNIDTPSSVAQGSNSVDVISWDTMGNIEAYVLVNTANAFAGSNLAADLPRSPQVGIWYLNNATATLVYSAIPNLGATGYQYIQRKDPLVANTATFSGVIDLDSVVFEVQSTSLTGSDIRWGLGEMSTENGLKVSLVEMQEKGGMWLCVSAWTGGHYDNHIGMLITEPVWYSVEDLTILPVELLEFRGFIDGPVNLLEWKTAVEDGSDFFVVERSSDGLDFSAIGTIDAIGFGSNYTFTDEYVKGESWYYRLKIVDIDGSFEYSNVIHIGRGDEMAIISVFPNPARQSTEITIQGPAMSQVFVHAADGRMDTTSGIIGYTGITTVRVNNPGVYFVTIMQPNGANITRKIVITE